VALAVLAVAPVTRSASAETYVVVVSPDVSMTDLSFEDLRRIFLFRQRFWKPNQPITLLYSEFNFQAGSFMLQSVYAMSRQDLKTLILRRLYSGDIDLAPKIVSSDETAVAFVGNGYGIVALVRADAVSADARARVLTIDGAAPGSAGYPLRR